MKEKILQVSTVNGKQFHFPWFPTFQQFPISKASHEST